MVEWGTTEGGALTAAGHTRRSQERGTEAHRAGAAHYARLQLGLHCRLLRRLSERLRRCHHVHGVHGCGVSSCPTAPVWVGADML